MLGATSGALNVSEEFPRCVLAYYTPTRDPEHRGLAELGLADPEAPPEGSQGGRRGPKVRGGGSMGHWWGSLSGERLFHILGGWKITEIEPSWGTFGAARPS